MVNILSKADLLEEAKVEEIEQWASEPDALMSALDDEASQGAQKLLSVELLRAFEGRVERLGQPGSRPHQRPVQRQLDRDV